MKNERSFRGYHNEFEQHTTIFHGFFTLNEVRFELKLLIRPNSLEHVQNWSKLSSIINIEGCLVVEKGRNLYKFSHFLPK